MLRNKIAELEEIKRKYCQNEESDRRRKYSPKTCKLRYLCFGCRGSIRRVYFKLINEQWRYTTCVNDPSETIRDFSGNDVSLLNFVTSMSVKAGVDDTEEFRKAGFTEAALEKDPDSGRYIIP